MGGIDQQQLLQRLTQMTQSAAAAAAGAEPLQIKPPSYTSAN
jgi:hypothetical protein